MFTMSMNIYEEAIRKYILYAQQLNLEISLSRFVNINKNLIAEELATKDRDIQQLKLAWGGRFGKVAQQSLSKNEYKLNYEQVDWQNLIEKGIEKAASIAEQRIRKKRNKATYEAFDTETDLVASHIRKRQLETNQSRQKAIRRIKYDNEEETSNRTSNDSLTNKSITEDSEVVEVVYDRSSLWLSDGSDYVPETNTEPSLPSIKFIKKFIWCLSMCEIGIIVTDKVEINTTNSTIKMVYDKAHNDIKTGNTKNIDLDTRLKLSGLFNSIDYEPQPISVGFVAEQVIFSPLTTQNINTLTSAMRNNELLRLDYNSLTMEELAVNHILTDIYFKHSAAKYREDTELSLLIDSLSCLFSTLWSSHSDVRLMWDKTSLTASANSPSSISLRPDMTFSTKLSNGQEYEIGNGEVKSPSVTKFIVNATRVRVLETAKRQLHKRMRISSAPNTLVTFGILIHGFSFEVYIVRYINGYYPYEKITWGELPRFNKVDDVLTHALRSMLTLKHSMQLSLADTDANDNNPDTRIETNLLPTVSYITIYKEAVNDEVAGSNR
ncbi:hypothetical protein G6F37_006159 [Rhizopus arrhizus]|nr:hypothetical protein G6F38_006306 [Rhizopus arrhizus]KAG1158048.1 hypothetical protein G6F37_006159 [Rhizopus arrhizus]